MSLWDSSIRKGRVLIFFAGFAIVAAVCSRIIDTNLFRANITIEVNTNVKSIIGNNSTANIGPLLGRGLGGGNQISNFTHIVGGSGQEGENLTDIINSLKGLIPDGGKGNSWSSILGTLVQGITNVVGSKSQAETSQPTLGLGAVPMKDQSKCANLYIPPNFINNEDRLSRVGKKLRNRKWGNS